jgi:hypothetical protein
LLIPPEFIDVIRQACAETEDGEEKENDVLETVDDGGVFETFDDGRTMFPTVVNLPREELPLKKFEQQVCGRRAPSLHSESDNQRTLLDLDS